MEAVLERYRADAAIVAEPTWLRLAIGHRGFVGLEVEVAGRAAHGSRPDRGLDAIVRMGRVLVGLDQLDRQLQAAPPHPLLGRASAHASVIAGGRSCRAWADSGLIAAAGVPTVLFGPGGEGLHETEEWVELADLERCLEVYLAVAGELCQ